MTDYTQLVTIVGSLAVASLYYALPLWLNYDLKRKDKKDEENFKEWDDFISTELETLKVLESVEASTFSKYNDVYWRYPGRRG